MFIVYTGINASVGAPLPYRLYRNATVAMFQNYLLEQILKTSWNTLVIKGSLLYIK